MENNEIIVNEEVVDVAEEILTDSSSMDALMYAGMGVAIAGAGYLFVTKLAIPAYKKLKAKKAESKEAGNEATEGEDFEESDEK